MIDAGQAFFDDMHKKNERLVKLCTDHQAQLLPHQGLSAIIDLDTLYNTVDFLLPMMNITDLESLAISEYKVYAIFGADTPKFKMCKFFNPDNASDNFFKATHRPDTAV